MELFEATFNQELDKTFIEIDERAATTVMLVSGGYPEPYEKGKLISEYISQNSSNSFVLIPKKVSAQK